MKRLLYGAGIVLSLSFFGSCAQHDPESPDTAGSVPYGEATDRNSTGVDTKNMQGAGDSLPPNMNNDRTNATKQSSTFDSIEEGQ
jgi:hypothetical protein